MRDQQVEEIVEERVVQEVNKETINDSIPLQEIRILTQVQSDDDEKAENRKNVKVDAGNIEGKDDVSETSTESNDPDGYMAYEKKVQKCSKYTLPYATASDDEEDEKNCFVKPKRKLEPLYVGDIIKFNEVIDGFRLDRRKIGMVDSIDRRKREIYMNTGTLLWNMSIVERLVGYDNINKKMITQNGSRKFLNDFDLINERPTENKLVLQDYIEQNREILNRNKERMKYKLRSCNLPSDLID